MSNFNPQEWDKKTEWDKKIKLSTMYEKQDKNGNPFFMGKLNQSTTITLTKTVGKYAKDGEYRLEIVPIKWIKKETNINNYSQSELEPDDKLPF